MHKNLSEERSRMQKLMGFTYEDNSHNVLSEEFIAEERDVVRTLPDKDIFVGNTLVPITFPDNIVLPIAPDNKNITTVEQITSGNMLPSLKEFIIKLKKNLAADYTPVSMSIDSGASSATANRKIPTGYSEEQVKFSYGDQDPDNQILADKRGTVILELLNRIIPTKWGGKYQNLNHDKIIENWNELKKLVKRNSLTEFKKYVSINVEGSKKIKGQAIYGCGKKIGVSGRQGNKDNNWIAKLAPIKEGDVQLDAEGYLNLGKLTEGKITLEFDPKRIPDAFKVTYNEKVTYVPFTSQFPEKMDELFVEVPGTNEKGGKTKQYIELGKVKTLIENLTSAQAERYKILNNLENSVSQKIRDYLQKIRAKIGKKINKPLTGWQLCKLKERDSEWLEEYFGWKKDESKYVYTEIDNLGFKLECGEFLSAVESVIQANKELTTNKWLKEAQKTKLVTYNKDTNLYTLDEEKVKELGGGSYNQRLKRAAEDATDQKIKELLIQGVVGKPQGVTIDKIYGKAKVRIEAIAPLDNTYFTIGLKCNTDEETPSEEIE